MDTKQAEEFVSTLDYLIKARVMLATRPTRSEPLLVKHYDDRANELKGHLVNLLDSTYENT